MAPSLNEADQTFSRDALIARVIGPMVGLGIFAASILFGRAAGGLGATIACICVRSDRDLMYHPLTTWRLA